MRIRLSPVFERHVHAMALKQGRSFQNTVDRIVDAGLRSTGMPVAAVTPALGDLSEGELTKMKIPLSPELRAQLRETAARLGRSQRKMTAICIAAGLKALGADVATVDRISTVAAGENASA
jgi:hypothetical protein